MLECYFRGLDDSERLGLAAFWPFGERHEDLAAGGQAVATAFGLEGLGDRSGAAAAYQRALAHAKGKRAEELRRRLRALAP